VQSADSASRNSPGTRTITRQKDYEAIDNKMDMDKDPGEVDIQDEKNQMGINGIANFGNTCFINATLNCLFKIQPLCEYFQSQLHLAELNESNPFGSKGKVTVAFGELLK